MLSPIVDDFEIEVKDLESKDLNITLKEDELKEDISDKYSLEYSLLSNIYLISFSKYLSRISKFRYDRLYR